MYLMKYAGKHFLEQSGRFVNVVLKTPTPVHKTLPLLSPLAYHIKAQNAHPDTKQPGGPYRDMGGRFGNTWLGHAKSEGGRYRKDGGGCQKLNNNCIILLG